MLIHFKEHVIEPWCDIIIYICIHTYTTLQVLIHFEHVVEPWCNVLIYTYTHINTYIHTYNFTGTHTL